MKKFDAEKELVKSILEDFKNRQIERKKFENTWQLNINFYLGNQYCYISPSGEILEYGKQYFWQEREVYNHIANLVEMRLAKLSRVRPTLNVIPFSDEDNDIACAKMSKKILKSVSSNLNISKILSQGTLWSEICGTVFYKVDWNNMAGRIIGMDEVGNEIKEGDIEISVVSPFEIYPDSNTYNNVDDCMSIIYARTFHKDVVKNTWGIDVEGKDIDVFTLDAIGSLGGLGYASMSNSLSKKLKKDQVLVLEKYEKPTVEFPNGRLTIIAGEKLVYIGDLPYINNVENKRGFPFIKQCCMPTPNCFWGTSVVERCIPIQRSYNAIKNRKHEFLNRLTMGIMSVEDGSLDIDNLEEEGLSPGKVLIYRQGSKAPELMSTGSVPADFQQEENSLLNEFVNVSGVTDFGRSGYYSSGNISGVALQLLIEQDEVRLVFSADEIRNCAKEMAKQILRLYKQFAVVSHTSRIVGDNGIVELFYWTGSDINSEEIVFETENEMNETIAQKRSMIFEILNAGLLTDEDGKISNRVRSRVLEQLGFGIWDNEHDMRTLHKNSADKENLTLIELNNIHEPVEVDDHNVHIEQHTAFLLGANFAKKVAKNPEIYEKMLIHIRKHKELQQLNVENKGE